MLLLGTISAVLGVFFALGQHDLKRLLAYHSIENIGIILMGLGLAMIGRPATGPNGSCWGLPAVCFMCGTIRYSSRCCFSRPVRRFIRPGPARSTAWAGSANGCRRRRMLFLVGAAAICGLPPLNGFISELLIYLGLFESLQRLTRGGACGAGAWRWSARWRSPVSSRHLALSSLEIGGGQSIRGIHESPR